MHKLLKILSFLLILLCCSEAQSKSKVLDSLQNKFYRSHGNEKVVWAIRISTYHLRQTDYAKSEEVLNDVEDLLKFANDKTSSDYFLSKGICKFQKGNRKEALADYQRSEIFAMKSNSTYNLYKNYLNIALCYYTLSKYSMSYRYFMKCYYKTFDKEHHFTHAYCCLNLSNLFRLLNNNEKSLKFTREGLAISNTPRLKIIKQRLLLNLSNLYVDQDSLKNAFSVLNSTLKDLKQTENKHFVNSCYLIYGDAYRKSGDIKNSFKYYKLALNHFKQKDSKEQLCKINQGLAQLYIKLKNYSEAEKSIDKSIIQSKTTKLANLELKSLKIKHQILKKQKKLKESVAVLSDYISKNDIISKRYIQQAYLINSMLLKENKDFKENNYLTEYNKEKELELKRKDSRNEFLKYISIISFGVLILLIIDGILLLNSKKRSQTKKRELDIDMQFILGNISSKIAHNSTLIKAFEENKISGDEFNEKPLKVIGYSAFYTGLYIMNRKECIENYSSFKPGIHSLNKIVSVNLQNRVLFTSDKKVTATIPSESLYAKGDRRMLLFIVKNLISLASINSGASSEIIVKLENVNKKQFLSIIFKYQGPTGRAFHKIFSNNKVYKVYFDYVNYAGFEKSVEYAKANNAEIKIMSRNKKDIKLLFSIDEYKK